MAILFLVKEIERTRKKYKIYQSLKLDVKNDINAHFYIFLKILRKTRNPHYLEVRMYALVTFGIC